MNDNIDMNAASLADFLGRIGLPPVARDRVLEIDRTLASELASDQPDVNGCAALVIEAADLIADLDPPGFDWAGWDDDDDPGDVDGFDFDGIEYGHE
ncbi:MAG: hypothetical protein BGN83_06245 [Rhizobium sp. 63-7]|nr:MAG: hypothetical protein BGN83_06245 [Rhizobium sp. 63-7]